MNREQLITAGQDPDLVAYNTFTLAQLHEAFDRVQNKENWKSEFKATIDGSDLEVTKAAAIFFTGGQITTKTTRDGRVAIHGLGYYHYTGS